MVLKKIYLFKLENGMEIFTTDKNELVDKLNEIYKENPLFVEYNIDKINNIIFKGNKKKLGISDVMVLNMDEYYKDLLDDYKKSLESHKLKYKSGFKNYESSVIVKKLKEYANNLYAKESVLRKSGIQDKNKIHKLLLEK